MKKLFITSILVSSLAMGAFANDGGKRNDKSSAAVSYSVLNDFSNDFKTAKNIVWTVNENCQKAEFMYNGKKNTAFYSLSGEYLGVTHNVVYNSVPVTAQKQIADQYKGYQVGEVIELQPKQSDYSNATPYTLSSFKDDSRVYFVDVKNDKEEVLLRVTPDASVYFYKQVK